MINPGIIMPCLHISIESFEHRGHLVVLITVLGILIAVTFLRNARVCIKESDI